jgi:hypothetical protein
MYLLLFFKCHLYDIVLKGVDLTHNIFVKTPEKGLCYHDLGNN